MPTSNWMVEPGSCTLSNSLREIPGAEVEFVDPAPVSCYCKKVPQERRRSCVLNPAESGQPGGKQSQGLKPRPGSSQTGPSVPGICSFLAKGRDNIATELARSPPWRAMRAGTGETELAPPWADDRPPSRFSSGSGTKADAKQQPQGFCAHARHVFRGGERKGGPKVLCAPYERGVTRFCGKEFQVAYF